MFLCPGVHDIMLSLYGHLSAYVVYFFIAFILSGTFILPSRESDHCTIRAHLGAAGHLSTTPRRENPVKCLSQRHNK